MKTKNILIIILIICLAVGVYFFLIKNKKVEESRCPNGFRFVPSTQTCESVDKPKESTIDFAQVVLKIPETQTIISLSKREGADIYTGTEEVVGNASLKQSASLNTKDMIFYSPELALVPFNLETGGTGQFVYIGLFDVKTNTHLSSVYVGDRIMISSLQVVNEKIKINFKTRLDSESFANDPSVPAQVVVEVKDQKLVEIMKLQNADYQDVEIKSPLAGSSVSDTLIVKGSIPGSWYFEASAQFRIIDSSYNEIAIGAIQALSEWMTTQRVPFELTLTAINYQGNATIIIQSENVQGGEEGEKMVKKLYIPVVFK